MRARSTRMSGLPADSRTMRSRTFSSSRPGSLNSSSDRASAASKPSRASCAKPESSRIMSAARTANTTPWIPPAGGEPRTRVHHRGRDREKPGSAADGARRRRRRMLILTTAQGCLCECARSLRRLRRRDLRRYEATLDASLALPWMDRQTGSLLVSQDHSQSHRLIRRMAGGTTTQRSGQRATQDPTRLVRSSPLESAHNFSFRLGRIASGDRWPALPTSCPHATRAMIVDHAPRPARTW